MIIKLYKDFAKQQIIINLEQSSTFAHLLYNFISDFCYSYALLFNIFAIKNVKMFCTPTLLFRQEGRSNKFVVERKVTS